MNDMIRPQKLFTIQEISQQLKIPKSTLRYWEKEFGDIFSPDRTKGGQRRYSGKHFSIIEKIIDLKSKGLSLLEIKRQLTIEHDKNIATNTISNIEALAERIAVSVKRELYSVFYDHGKLP